MKNQSTHPVRKLALARWINVDKELNYNLS
jgi:hypothetical protein